MSELNSQAAICDINRNNHYVSEWALVHKGELAGLYDSFESAWSEAAIRFRRRRCLIRQVSPFPITLTVSADNLQPKKSKLLASFQKWARFFTRQLFTANETPS